MSVPESEYKNQKCSCFIEIEKLESSLAAARGEVEKLQNRMDQMSDTGAVAYQNFKEVEAQRDRYREALEKMSCSELLDCQQPITNNSRHSTRCDWYIAHIALLAEGNGTE